MAPSHINETSHNNNQRVTAYNANMTTALRVCSIVDNNTKN